MRSFAGVNVSKRGRSFQQRSGGLLSDCSVTGHGISDGDWLLTMSWQSNPKAVTALASAWGHQVMVVPGGEHSLDKDYVAMLLDQWLKQ